MTTMAMHRASPTTIRPVRYSGRSGRKSQARANISAGPSTQLSTREGISSRRSRVTAPSRSYRTLARTGYIITSRPSAIGSETPLTPAPASASPRPGTARPRARPSGHGEQDPPGEMAVEEGEAAGARGGGGHEVAAGSGAGRVRTAASRSVAAGSSR